MEQRPICRFCLVTPLKTEEELERGGICNSCNEKLKPMQSKVHQGGGKQQRRNYIQTT